MVADVGIGRRRLALLASLAMLSAGVLHLLVVRQHWAHAPAHGLFFLIAGIFQIGWAVAFWRTVSRPLTQVGFVVAIGLIVLWAATRLLPAPLGHGPEEVDLAGIATKACEIVCTATLALLLATTFATPPGIPAWRYVAALALVSIILAAGTYGVTTVAEPLLPFLSAPSDEGHDSPHEKEQHDQAPLPGPQRGDSPARVNATGPTRQVVAKRLPGATEGLAGRFTPMPIDVLYGGS